MGYYTRFDLEIPECESSVDGHKKAISELTSYGPHFGCFDDSIKWYDYEEDMRKYSKQHPETLFKLIGEGEETGDLWHAYFKNGKMQMCKAVISFPPYDENQLTAI